MDYTVSCQNIRRNHSTAFDMDLVIFYRKGDRPARQSFHRQTVGDISNLDFAQQDVVLKDSGQFLALEQLVLRQLAAVQQRSKGGICWRQEGIWPTVY